MSRIISAKRKLIPERQLQNIHDLVKLGVPLTTVIKKKQLDISRPVVSKLLKLYKVELHVVQESIFPPWLKSDGPSVQESPDDWYYTGFFPYGEWNKR